VKTEAGSVSEILVPIYQTIRRHIPEYRNLPIDCHEKRVIWPYVHLKIKNIQINYRRRPSLFYPLTVGVEVVYLHLITLRRTPQSVGVLWTRDRPVAETSTWQHKHSQETNIHAAGGIRTHDPSKRSAADLRLRPRGHWDWPNKLYTDKFQTNGRPPNEFYDASSYLIMWFLLSVSWKSLLLEKPRLLYRVHTFPLLYITLSHFSSVSQRSDLLPHTGL
jgi:hypothetical protein